jgi:hypothetical protein
VEKDIQHAADAELMVRGAGRIRFKENDESRYLGPSSGIAITRLVMEMAKLNTDSKSIKDVVPELTAHEIKSTFAQESSKPTSKIYPMISSVPQPHLPPRNLTYRLIDLFVVKGTSSKTQPVLYFADVACSASNAPNCARTFISTKRRGCVRWLRGSLPELPAPDGYRY